MAGNFPRGRLKSGFAMLKARGGRALSESGARQKSRLQAAVAGAVARTEFLDRQAASEILDRIAGQVPTGTVETLITLLPDSPDPDGSLSSFERLLESGGRELARLLDRHRFLIHYALAVFGYSRFLGDTRSEEHTSELQSPVHLVCRLLLEKKKTR